MIGLESALNKSSPAKLKVTIVLFHFALLKALLSLLRSFCFSARSFPKPVKGHFMEDMFCEDENDWFLNVETLQLKST